MKCKIMAIVNVTPDSFSDGGKYFRPEEAIRRAYNAIEEGAEYIDFGGESTRPGSVPLTWQEEWSRLEPVLAEIKNRGSFAADIKISVDTYHPETAERALQLGAHMINCVYADPISDMAKLCARKGAELVIPYRGEKSVPASDGSSIPLNLGFVASVERDKLWLDPMIGFGTEREEDVELLRMTSEFAKEGNVLIGASRKRLIKKLTGEKVTGKNLGGNVGLAVWAALNGAGIVRVHDVRETVQAIMVAEALEGDR